MCCCARPGSGSACWAKGFEHVLRFLSGSQTGGWAGPLRSGCGLVEPPPNHRVTVRKLVPCTSFWPLRWRGGQRGASAGRGHGQGRERTGEIGPPLQGLRAAPHTRPRTSRRPAPRCGWRSRRPGSPPPMARAAPPAARSFGLCFLPQFFTLAKRVGSPSSRGVESFTRTYLPDPSLTSHAIN